MTFRVKVLSKSVNTNGDVISSFELLYPRFIHPEFMTHRVFGRNASSSRAVPVRRMIDDIIRDPAMPVFWGMEEKGMVASQEFTGSNKMTMVDLWLEGRDHAINTARKMVALGAHKQTVNRILEPYAHISVVMTTTKLYNFFRLRTAADAQPEIRALAVMMRDEYDAIQPTVVHDDEWHMPYVEDHSSLATSVARCARVSYLNHDGTTSDKIKDSKLADRLAKSEHWTPFEHQAMADAKGRRKNDHRHLTGWVPYRAMLDGQ